MNNPTAQEICRDVADARLDSTTSSRNARIIAVAQKIAGGGSVFYALADTPEQITDVFRILVDDRLVVGFELSRRDLDAAPEEVVIYTIDEYSKAIDGGGMAEHSFPIALELAKADLAG